MRQSSWGLTFFREVMRSNPTVLSKQLFLVNCRQTWIRSGFNKSNKVPNIASSWSGPMPAFIGSSSTSSPSTSGGTGRNRDSTSRSDSRDNSRKRSRSSAPPFVAQKPLMAFAGTAIPHESPFVTIWNRNGRDWPKILDPEGKVDYCQLCFACCFPAPYNRCKDPEQCSVSRRPAYVRARSSSRSDPPRLHVDLQHSKWRPDNYPERLWASVIDFIKRNKDVVAPSETLKELTPPGRLEAPVQPSEVSPPRPLVSPVLSEACSFRLKDSINLPKFISHPPPHVQHPWPGSGQCQGCPKFARWVDVWVHVADSGFLSNDDLDGLYKQYSFLASWVKFGPLWISPPWPPSIRRRLWGFGRISPARSCAHDWPGHLFVIHFVWPYLFPEERERAAKAYVHWELYAILRRRAVLLPLRSLHTLRSERVGGPASL
eukprot:scaffold4737_cov92-Cylindrotheca_fusiformis.AAC.3